MKHKTPLILSLCALATALPTQPKAASPNTRTWHDTKGRELVATFRGIKDDNIFLEDAGRHGASRGAGKPESGYLAMAKKTLKVEGLGIPVDPGVAKAAAAIDKLVLARVPEGRPASERAD